MKIYYCIAVLSGMFFVSQGDNTTVDSPEKCSKHLGTCGNTPCKTKAQHLGNCGEGLNCCRRSIRKEATYSSVNVQDQGIEGTNEIFNFTLTIKGQATPINFKGLEVDIKAYLKRKNQITLSSLDVQGPGTGVAPHHDDKMAPFLLSIQGQGKDAALKRLVREINLILKSGRPMKDISLTLEGKGFDPNLKIFIQDINASLQQYFIDVSRSNEEAHFILVIQGQETAASLNTLLQEINAFIKRERQKSDSSVNIKGPEITVAPNPENQKTDFTLKIQVQGSDVSLNTLVQEIKTVLKRVKEITHSSLNIKVQRLNAVPGVSGVDGTVDSPEKCSKLSGICRKEQCDTKDKNIGNCGVGSHCCSSLRDQTANSRLDIQSHGKESSPKRVSFTVTIKNQETDVSFHNFVQDLKAFLKTKGHITSTSLDIQGPETTGSPSQGNTTLQFALSIKHEETNTSLNKLIQEIKASLKHHGIDIPPNNGKKRPPFILIIHG